MSDQSGREKSGHHSIQLLVHGDTDRKALTEFLGDRYEVIAGDILHPVDCYVVDEQMVPTYRDVLREYKQEADPTFTPVLLIQQDASKGTVPLPSEENGDGPPLIDEVVTAPVNRTTLFRRVGNLLARRDQSVELSDRYEDIQTRFQRLFDSTNDALFVITPSGDEITECNPAACDLVGYSRDELLSVSLIDTIHADDSERFQSFLKKVQHVGQDSTDNVACQTKEGAKRQLEVSAATLNDAGRSPIILSARDVTNRRLREQQLGVLNRVLRHNLRNGTQVIRGNATLLKEALNDDELRTHVSAIEERTAALSRLSNQAETVRSLFDNESPAKICDITKLLTEVVNEVSQSYPDATLTTSEPESIHARADSQLKRALSELLENAITHNDQPAPEITVTTRASTRDRSGEWVEIVISDNGPGIPDQEQKTIEIGEETPLQHSTGLGLWIVYWTVSLSGGEVSLENNSPRGTRVILSLPRASADSSPRVTPADHH